VRLFHILQSRLRSLFFRDRREAELSEELQLHLEREIERLQASGLSREEARLQALRLFGGVEQIKEESRDARGTMFVDNLIRDIRYGLRRLVRDWRFTSAAVLILGLAIGANTAIFSVVNAVLFRDPPFADPDRLVDIYQNDRAGKPMIVIGYPFYQSMAEYTDIFATTMAASIPVPLRYLHDRGIRGGTVEFATATYLDVLGRRPSLGRWFDETEDRRGGPIVAVLGHQTWTRVFRADPSIVGRVVRIQGMPVTIVGVGPANHRGTLDVGLVTDFWVPMTRLRDLNPSTDSRDAKVVIAPLFVKARLREGATVPQAQAAMDVLARRIEADYPDLFRGSGSGEFALGKGISVIPTTDVRVHPQADVPMIALASLVLAIVGLVLAIACSNLATLLLVRGAARAKEVAVRLAVGGTRRQLVRHLLTESLLLSAAGGIAGCILAWWGMRALQGVELPITVDLTLDYRVLAFAIVLSLVTGVVFGLAPALKATRLDLLPTLRDEGLQPLESRRLTLKNALIVAQVAISVLLLGGTSIFLQQLAVTRTPRVGYAVDGVAMLETDVRFAGYSADAAANVYDEILRRIAAIPGVQAAALSYGRPLEAADAPMVVEGSAGETGSPASMIWAGPGFFDTLRIPVLHGRVFDARDRAGAPSVAVITETVARQYFGAVDAVGRRFRKEHEPNTWTEVIGVVRDTAGDSVSSGDVLARQPRHFFRPFTQSGLQPTTVVARSSGPADALVGAMQRELRAVDVTLPVMTAQTMARDLENARAPAKVLATFLGALGGLGLVLASIGLYAVVAFTVARRSREIGIRMALGARSQQVVWSIARGVAGLIGVGTGIGLFLTVLLMLAMRASSGEANIGIGNMDVYRPSIDPVALLAIAAMTAVVGVAAAFVPAQRATRMHPLVALRHE
jgi:macrolide transport system ATP-binding/permease protein